MRRPRHLFALLIAVPLLMTALTASAASNFWIDKASSGDPRAQYNLARMYLWGMDELGIEQDNTEAFNWFKKAADQGYAAAQYELAISFQQGRGTAKDPRAAAKWFEAARKQGYVPKDTAPSRRGGGGGVYQPGKTAMPPGAVLSLLMNMSLDETIHAVTTVSWFSGWWPWWLGAIALGLVTIGFWLANRVTLGVSSSWDRLVSWREDAELARADAMLRDAPTDTLAAALMAETMAEFGDALPPDLLEGIQGQDEVKVPQAKRTERTRWTVHLTFLLANVIGGFLAYLLSGNWQLHMDMGPEHTRFFGGGAEAMLILFAGGVLIGFGTRLGGGCTSGHGLSGCSRLQVGSLVGTATFFGTAIIVSLLIAVLLG